MDVFAPRVANVNVTSGRGSGFIILAIQLVPGTDRLVISTWATGATLLDLDLHGGLQLLCLNHPCLNLCANPDAGSSPALDGSADLPVALDESGEDSVPQPPGLASRMQLDRCESSTFPAEATLIRVQRRLS